MEKLFAAFAMLGLVCEEANEYLRTILQHDVFKKNFIIVRPGEINRRIYFIESGLIRHYVSKGVKEMTHWILPENNFAVIHQSFFDQIASNEYMQALENTIVWSITYNQLKETIRLYKEFQQHEHVINHKYRVLGDNIRLELAGLGPDEKYSWLLRTQPDLITRVKLPILASYLDVSINTLKDIRNKRGYK